MKTEIEFHRNDMCVIQGDKCAALTFAQGSLFYRLWASRGKWLTPDELLITLDGDKVPSIDKYQLARQHIFAIRKALLEADGGPIDLRIENQRGSFWGSTKYRIVKETAS